MEFSVNNIDLFYRMANFAHKPHYNEMDLKCSPDLFSLVVSRRCPARCIIQLQLRPQFFTQYVCTQSILRTTSVYHFFSTVLQMKNSPFNFMTFTLDQALECLQLSFLAPTDPNRPCHFFYLPLLLTYQEVDVCEILSATYVSFDSLQLLWILALLNASHVIFTVTLTNSQAMFTGIDAERHVRFILSVEAGDCIIHGVAEGEETQFVIVLNPIESFYNLICWSNLRTFVKIYKSYDNIHGTIVILMGMYARYVVYSSE